MKRIFSEFNDPRYYTEHERTPDVSPGFSYEQILPKTCAHCKVNPVPRSTMNKPVAPNRKYCDDCMPVVKALHMSRWGKGRNDRK